MQGKKKRKQESDKEQKEGEKFKKRRGATKQKQGQQVQQGQKSKNRHVPGKLDPNESSRTSATAVRAQRAAPRPCTICGELGHTCSQCSEPAVSKAKMSAIVTRDTIDDYADAFQTLVDADSMPMDNPNLESGIQQLMINAFK